MKRGDKKGQVTIFVIIGVVIVALIAIIYFLFPSVFTGVTGGTQNPYEYFQTCMEDSVTEAVNTVSAQGGSADPEHYIVYNGENIEYLCYTNENYKPCVMQQPMLKNHVEEEILISIEGQANLCLDDMKESFEKRGYDVDMRKRGFEVELLPKRVIIRSNTTMTLNKGGSEEYDKFKVILNNNLYELISIANSILNFEARYGDSETTTYMNYYRDLKVEKKKQIEGSTVYILTDLNTLNKFQFASRSYPWPAGYGLNE